ncbi:MAG: UDP-2,3-diacylglucosamine diphosphatase [Gammaproteobacteria bacterium]|nr:UDP-2,3-diacylglucosamine diphosphatase [Gammaproteobacteria bacterium]
MPAARRSAGDAPRGAREVHGARRGCGVSRGVRQGGGCLNTVEKSARRKQRYRSVWISDVHLGTAGCKAEYLLDFLRHHECEQLYLVGDIIDGWRLKRRWYWPQSHNDVMQKVLRKARKGTKITYVVGNHDEALRQFLGLSFGEIPIVEEAEHVLADGRRLLVVHGDRYDAVVQRARWLALLGDHLYAFILRVNHWYNHVRARCGLGYWSLSQYLKHRAKNAVAYIYDFETALAREARERGYDGVVCGHIHKPGIREIEGVLYCNDGDWVESLSALVETPDGRLAIVEWRERGVEPLELAA